MFLLLFKAIIDLKFYVFSFVLNISLMLVKNENTIEKHITYFNKTWANHIPDDIC